jgi:DNA-binding IclR family transcriptional regulator
MTSPSTEDATAQHVRRTLRVLEMLSERPRTQADVAHELGVHRRTARRVLARLVDEGYAEPWQQGRHVAYRPTSRLAILGRQVAEGLDLVAIADRYLTALDAGLAGVRFIALLEADGVQLAHVVPSAERDAAERLPRTGPLHATAAGKVFLSADTALLGETLNQQLLAFTARTLVTRADLLLELAAVRERGYAIEDGEHEPGICTLASGVVNHVGRVVAALGAVPIAGTSLQEVGELVRGTAAACSRELGAPASASS